MRKALTQWSSIFFMFAANVVNEISFFFENNGRTHRPNGPKGSLYKIPRLGR
jgi:hypothetical protein